MSDLISIYFVNISTNDSYLRSNRKSNNRISKHCVKSPQEEHVRSAEEILTAYSSMCCILIEIVLYMTDEHGDFSTFRYNNFVRNNLA